MSESGPPCLALKCWDVILAYGACQGIGFEADYSVETCRFRKAKSRSKALLHSLTCLH